MLLLETVEALALPGLGYPDEELRFQYVGRFNLFIVEQLGLQVNTVGRFQSLPRADHGAGFIDRFYGFELQGSDHTSVAHRWLDLEGLRNVQLVDPNHLPVIEAWLDFSQRPLDQTLAAPWHMLGWYSEAENWIQQQLATLDLRLVDHIEQIILWERSAIIRVPTDAGNLYFKSSPRWARQEVTVTKWLADHIPVSAPELVAVDEERLWVLSRDYGRTLRDELESPAEAQNIHTYANCMGEYASVQIASSSHIEELLELDCPDRRLNVLAQEYPALIDYAETVNQLGSNLINAEGFRHLRELTVQVEARCEQLDRIGIPPSLEHGDLHAEQVAIREGRFVFTDWSDCSISHPFFSLPPAFYYDLRVFADREGARLSAVQAYLKRWSQFATFEELQRAYDLAEQLAFIHRAMLYHRLVSFVDNPSEWEMHVVGYLSMALDRIPKT